MIQKQSWLNISDGTNVQWIQTFHLYKGFYKKFSKIGFFVKGSAKIVEPPKLSYKGFKTKYIFKGDICRALFIRCNKILLKKDHSFLYLKKNNAILIKKKQIIKSKYFYGFISRTIKRKKFIALYDLII